MKRINVRAYLTLAGIFAIGLPVSLNLATGPNAPGGYSLSTNLAEKVTLGDGCYGRSDYPHISKHFPDTANVTAETRCPGRHVSVKTVLSRPGWFIFRESVSGRREGQNDAKINVAMKCKWIPGQPPIEYIVESVHRDGTGAWGRTKLRSFLRC